MEKKTDKSDLRKYYTSKLSGDGIDIGPLHRPMVKHDGMKVRTVDTLTLEDMRKHYPELREYPLQEPDILCDGQYLDGIDSKSLDFVIGSHVIEHMKSPLLALQNWHTVCKTGGHIYLVAPDYRHIFDKKREPTTLDHVIMDYHVPSEERDWTHYIEYSELVDGCERDKIAQHALDMKLRNYSLHYHCWTPESFFDLLEYFSKHHRPLETIEGPGIDKDDPHEFHYLLTVKR